MHYTARLRVTSYIMKSGISHKYKPPLSPARITAIYVIVGSLWIVLTSFWADQYFQIPNNYSYFETSKGLIYVALTALLLWWLCRSWSRQISAAVKRHESAQPQYETYVKNSPISITVINQKGNIEEANTATEVLTGYSKEELETMNIFNLDATQSPEETAAVFEEIFTHGQASKERLIRHKDGSHKHIVVDGVHFEADHAICFARDITDRKISERKLLMLNAMLRAIRRVNKAIVEVPDTGQLIQRICDVLVEDRDFKHAWIALLNSDGRPQHYCDSPSLADAGKIKDFLNEGKLQDCLSNSTAQDGLILARKPVEQCPDFPMMEGLENCALLGMHFTYDHSEGYIALMANPAVIDDEEELSLFREVCGDLKYALHTIRIEAEKTQAMVDILQAKQAAEAANKAKDDFLAVMSHELRTPLNPIIGFSEMLLEETKSENEKIYAETILKAGNRQLELIDDILHYTRLHRGAAKINPENFHLVELCESTLHEASVDAGELELRFTNGGNGVAVSQAQEVFSDQVVIRSILDNLIGNACKYTNEGKVTLDLSQSEENAGEYIFSVKDTGIGIEPTVQELLFEPFSQADSSYTRRHEGIGLGLAICKELVGLLNGDISVESTIGVGSTFRVRLPIVPIVPKEDLTKMDSHKEKQITNKYPQFDRSLNILIVDDKPDNLFVLEKLIERAGGQVTQAEDGEAALESCKSNVYDAILMDLAMPKMNGLEASKAIRTDGLNKSTPIIAVTADAAADVPEHCYAAGIQTVLTKPINARKLVETIQAQLKKA